MVDDAVERITFVRLNIPACGRLGDQHHASLSAGPAQVILRTAYRQAACGDHRPPGAFASQILRGWHILWAHARPVALEFFGDEHRQSGQAALPHFRASYANGHGIVRINRDPDGDFRHIAYCGRRRGVRRGGLPPQDDDASRGGYTERERASANGGTRMAHGDSVVGSPRRWSKNPPGSRP
jgi:hypothetical protein